MTKSQFEFQLSDGATATLDVYEDPNCPYFIVHKPIGTTRPSAGWVLSHKPSSAYLAGNFRTRELAFAAAAELTPLADWSKSNPRKGLSLPDVHKVSQLLAAIGRRNLKARA